jgi:ABC-type dipeptide/oligopeptide/nickel transport system ATPase subunit
MAKITTYIPEPKSEYDVENQRQIIESLTTMKQQLNTSYLQDQKEELERFTWFNG